jgi:hypothetical protein
MKPPMKPPLPPWITILLLIAYTVAGGVALNVAEARFPRPEPVIAILSMIVFVVGWFWLLGIAVNRSAKAGLLVLKLWIAYYGALALAVAPIALMPYPLTIIVGWACAVAWFTWLTEGKPHMMPPLSWFFGQNRG